MTTSGPREEPAVTLLESRFTQDDLPRLRLLVEQYANREGLPEPRLGEFVVAMDAVAVNAVEEPDGAGRLVLQRSDGHLICRIMDPALDPGPVPVPVPVPVRVRVPDLDLDPAGPNLWLVDRLTDGLTVESGPSGTVVTLAVRLPYSG
ncbi:ATP-binding protein [Streptomyces flavofungini]|uniref:ATP-binding protein n=1 Tax=Streptomyces flavofungini TaxID=68200 RepID=UPI0034E03EAA